MAALVFAVLVIAGLLHWLAATLAFLCLGATVLVYPRAASSDPSPDVQTTSESELDGRSVRAFADALGEPCLILDRRLIIIHRNGAAAQQFPTILAGNPLAFSLRHPDVIGAAGMAARTGEVQTVELHQTVPTETWHRVRFAPLHWGEGGEGLLVVTLHSLTEQKRVEAMRQDFIANVSHELRTPLTSLIGFIDTLLGPAAHDSSVRIRFLELMRGQAERMARLVEDLLSLSRIELRQHLRPTGSVDLALVLREVREGLHTLAESAGAPIGLELPNGPAVVTGDREELYEVFQNLIENAIKYGAGGGKIEVSLQLLTDRPGQDFCITVLDHGPGVDEEHVPRLTERFYRVDAESSRKKKGTGLGLAIVKHIVTRHRGVLSIRSRRGEGMRVEVQLPR